MIGAISGDVIGSVHEGAPAKAKDFPLFVAASTFTDDTVLTVELNRYAVDKIPALLLGILPLV